MTRLNRFGTRRARCTQMLGTGVTVCVLCAATLGAGVLTADASSGEVAQAAAVDVPPADAHKEHLDDPAAPVPRQAPRTAPRAVITRGPYTSVQVNVDANGNDILSDAANEPSIAVDPNDRNRMAIGWRQFDNIASNFRQAGHAFSTNGGLTWTNPGPLTPGTFRSDPVLGANANGDFFYYSLMNDFTAQMFRSFDGGAGWGPAIPAFGGDKAWMTIDTTSGPGAGNIYIAWSWVAGCCGLNVFTRSTDGGLTYDTPITIPGTPIWGTLTVAADGTLYVTGRALGAGAPVYRSTNASDALATPVFQLAANVDLGGTTSSSTGPNPGGLLGQVWIAADHSSGPTAGGLYVLGSVNPSGTDPLDVMFASSFDGGVTWSPPVRVNDDPPLAGAYQWLGTMSVAPNGRIDVVWNDMRTDPGGSFSELYYSQSVDGGVTWSVNVPLSPPFNHFLGYPNQNKMGDYFHMVSDNTGADLAYAATFTGGQDVYHIRIPANDCNANGIADELDLAAGTSADCDGNSQPDECQPDCNSNGVPDPCEIIAASALDCNLNVIPDECEPDCNTSGIPDDCDVTSGASLDCNTNLVPDECEPDCNANGIPDDCDIGGGASTDLNGNKVPDDCEDCNSNGIPDDLDLAGGTGSDCNSNSVVDTCDIAAGSSNDCDADSIPDECEPDCNGNGVADDCDIAAGTSTDCLASGIPDECRLDCNTNGVADVCEIAAGSADDCDGNGLIDQCEPAGQGYALGFDGVDDYVDAGTGLALSTGLTIEARVRPDATTGKHVIISKRETAPVAGYALFVEDGKLVFSALGVLRFETTGAVVAAHTWTHVAVTLDAGLVVRFYIDGSLVDTIASGVAVAPGTGAVFIGALPPSGGDFWVGELDELRVWSEARAPQAIAQAAGIELPAGTPSLAAYWRFNAGAGTVAKDVSGVSDGTLVNGTAWVSRLTDCNSNGISDRCDIAAGTSADTDANGVPDECSADCNANGIPDSAEIAAGSSADCNANQIPDVCDIAAGTSADCTGDLVPDECQTDCNSDGVADVCEVFFGTATDCNANGRLDVCESGQSTFSLRFDGASSYVDAGNRFNDLANGFTIELWVRPNSIAGKQVIISKRTPSPLSGWALFQTDGVVTFTSLGVQAYATSSAVLAAGQWTHIAVVFDSANNVKFYIDGMLFESVAGGAPVVTGNGRVFLGRLSPDGADYFDGDIDEVRIWRLERPGAAIAATRFARLTGDETQLAAYWPMDEGAGAAALDLSPSAISAVLHGAAWAGGVPVDTDCNSNGVFDACDVLMGVDTDCNANGVLDGCDAISLGDFNVDGLVGVDDAPGWVLCHGGPGVNPAAPCLGACLAAFDADSDGDVDLADFAAFQQALSP